MKGLTTVIAVAVLAAGTGCGGNPSEPNPAPSSASSGPGLSASPAGPTPPGANGSTIPASASWTTDPVIVVRNPPVPPVPVVTGVRFAAHPQEGFDRLVLDIPDALPGYSVKYVNEVRQDGTGDHVTLPGKAYLLVVLNPAQAHRDDGTVTISGIHRTNLPVITSYGVVGDYEGYVSIALGLTKKSGYHIGELPDRLYVDIRS